MLASRKTADYISILSRTRTGARTEHAARCNHPSLSPLVLRYNIHMNQPSVFTKIINRELPAHILYEDDMVIAFLSIAPITTGHTVIVPKQQIARIWDIPDDVYEHIFAVAKDIARNIEAVYSPDRVGMIVDGTDTADHAHLNVLQLNGSQDIHSVPAHPSQEDLAAEAQKLVLK